jgi:hypothetical protein
VSGNQYVLVVYEYDGNYIYGAPMPDRTGLSIIAAYKMAIRLFELRCFKPLLQRLDNEASRALQPFMDVEDIDFHLPPVTYTDGTPLNVPLTRSKITL